MWSNAVAHCGVESRSEILDLNVWRINWTAGGWRQYLAARKMESKLRRFAGTPTKGDRWIAQSLCRLSKGR
jgi:hypothetical protein